ncbi:MAG: hypothetical protein KAG66_02865 [Methylococcales bacterium]|nr:hypothetical protein [Methylococcales bacterium]
MKVTVSFPALSRNVEYISGVVAAFINKSKEIGDVQLFSAETQFAIQYLLNNIQVMDDDDGGLLFMDMILQSDALIVKLSYKIAQGFDETLSPLMFDDWVDQVTYQIDKGNVVWCLKKWYESARKLSNEARPSLSA